MKRFDLYLYLFLTAAVWIAIVLAPMWAQSPNIAAKVIALPFLGWLVLTAYYLVRWPGQRMGWLQKEDQHLHERQPANAAKT